MTGAPHHRSALPECSVVLLAVAAGAAGRPVTSAADGTTPAGLVAADRPPAWSLVDWFRQRLLS